MVAEGIIIFCAYRIWRAAVGFPHLWVQNHQIIISLPLTKNVNRKKLNKRICNNLATNRYWRFLWCHMQAISGPPCQCPYCTLQWLGASRGCAQKNRWGISWPKYRGKERRRRVDEIRYLRVDFAQTAFIPRQPDVLTSKPFQHKPDRHHWQHSYLKECWYICVYYITMYISCKVVLPCAFSRRLWMWCCISNIEAPSILPVASSDFFPLTSGTERPSLSHLHSVSPLALVLTSTLCASSSLSTPTMSVFPLGGGPELIQVSSVSTALVWPFASIEFSRHQTNPLPSKPLLPSINCLPCTVFFTSSTVSPPVVSSAEMAV